jgi:hypothetical protein
MPLSSMRSTLAMNAASLRVMLVTMVRLAHGKKES